MFSRMLKIITSSLLVLLLMFCCCTNGRNTSTLSQNLCSLPLDSMRLRLNPLKKYFSNYSGYIYIMNSECSECIGSFISFVNDLDKSGYSDTVLAIISPATQPIINHYIKKRDLSKRVMIILLESDKDEWGISSLESVNGMVYYLKENKINNIYQYFPLK